jgi:transposase
LSLNKANPELIAKKNGKFRGLCLPPEKIVELSSSSKMRCPQLTPSLTRMWYPKGRQPEPAMWTKTRQKTHIFGVINVKDGRFHSMQADWINSKSFLVFLKRLEKIYKRKRIVLILDNAKWHKSKKVWAYLRGRNIYLLFLPPYCPNLNPTEKVWKLYRKNVTHNYFHETLENLIRNSSRYLRSLNKDRARLAFLCRFS